MRKIQIITLIFWDLDFRLHLVSTTITGEDLSVICTKHANYNKDLNIDKHPHINHKRTFEVAGFLLKLYSQPTCFTFR